MPLTNPAADTMNHVSLRQVIDDFIITMDSDDYISNVNDAAIRNIALRGIREFGFDVTSRIRSLKRTVESNGTVTLPDDYVDLSKIGVVVDGIVYVLGENKNINMNQIIEAAVDNVISTEDSEGGTLPIEANVIQNRDDDGTDTAGSNGTGNNDYDFYVFQNYLYQGGLGRLYGSGGAHLRGYYRINLEQNRIELDTDIDVSEVVLEYIADEARST